MKEIKLTNSDKVALVDDCDYETINQYKWCYNAGYPLSTNGKYKLHRFIYELHYGKIQRGMVVDHIDRNPLNDQLSNLRLCSQANNTRNSSRKSNNTSGYRGVSKTTTTEKRYSVLWEKTYWRARIRTNNKSYTKYFPFTEEGKIQAARWYDIKAKELFSEFCGELNFPDED